MSGHCMLRPAVSTAALCWGCDGLAVAQRRQSFSVLLLLLSSVIKGRGKSRRESWALIAFHGREERAAVCPEGLRRCWALSPPAPLPPPRQEPFQGRHAHLFSHTTCVRTDVNILQCNLQHAHKHTMKCTNTVHMHWLREGNIFPCSWKSNCAKLL